MVLDQTDVDSRADAEAQANASKRGHMQTTLTLRKGRTWAIAVRRGSYKSLFLLNSGRFSLEKREIQF